MHIIASNLHHIRDVEAPMDRSKDPLNAARGIMVGGAISVCLWVAIAVAIY